MPGRPVSHGTYCRGCRCAGCVEAGRAYRVAYRADPQVRERLRERNRAWYRAHREEVRERTNQRRRTQPQLWRRGQTAQARVRAEARGLLLLEQADEVAVERIVAAARAGQLCVGWPLADRFAAAVRLLSGPGGWSAVSRLGLSGTVQAAARKLARERRAV